MMYTMDVAIYIYIYIYIAYVQFDFGDVADALIDFGWA